MDHETSERDGYFLNDDKQHRLGSHFKGLAGIRQTVVLCWEPVNIQRKYFQLDGT